MSDIWNEMVEVANCYEIVDLLVKAKAKKVAKIGSAYKDLLRTLANEDLNDRTVAEKLLKMSFEIDPKKTGKYLVKKGFPAEKLESMK